jgi:hypothetical protein
VEPGRRIWHGKCRDRIQAASQTNISSSRDSWLGKREVRKSKVKKKLTVKLTLNKETILALCDRENALRKVAGGTAPSAYCTNSLPLTLCVQPNQE